MNKNNNLKLYLAPMAGVTDLTFRMLCHEQGAYVTCTEMVSAKAMSFNNRKTFDLLKKFDGEGPCAVQLFGNEPEIMADAAKRLQDDFDFIDINMGCPVLKIVSNGEGSALMKEPELAEKIVSAVVKSVKKPVTVKIRAGYYNGEILAPEFAKRLEGAGASAITLHGRTKEQMYSGKADLDVIKKTVESVKIPVIGNGDVKSPEDAEKMIQKTGCAGVMIGRGAMGNPWVFSGRKPEISEIRDMIIRHINGIVIDKGEKRGVCEMRGHISWYTQGLAGSALFRKNACQIKGKDELINAVYEYFNSLA